MKAVVILVLRLLVLTVLYFICFAAVSAALLPVPTEQTTLDQPGSTLTALLAVSLINTLVLSYVILRSRWAGWKLILAIFFVFYGVTTVMAQIETAYFITRLPPGMLPRLFLSGAIIAALFSLLAVLILGKTRPDSPELNRHRLEMSKREWIVKLSLIVIIYLLLYFSFGYFIAWQNEALRAYYGGSDPGNFLIHMRNVLRDTPSLPLLQVVRALMWTAIAIPVIRMMKGQWWKAALAVALLFGVLMNSQLLLPNPLMPHEVRMVHLLETATSNFLFGYLLVAILTNTRKSTSKNS